MAIIDNGTRNQYTATAGQTVFQFTFEIFESADITVEQNGSVTTDFTLTGVGNDNGGNVILNTGATAGDILTIYRDMDLDRETVYQQNGDFLADTVNNDFDRVWAAVQQVFSTANVGIRPNINDPILNASNTELADISIRAGRTLGFGPTGLIDYLSGAIPVGTLREFSTVAAMVIDTNGVLGDVVLIDNYTATNTSGLLVGSLVAAATGTDDGGSFIDLPNTTPALQWKQSFQNLIGVKQFGANGDGVNDSTATIAAKSFAAATGGVLFFSPIDPAVYEIKGVPIDGPATEVPEIGQSLTILAPNGALLQNTAADGTDMFIVAATTSTNFLKMDIAAIQSAAGGGHIIDLQGTMNHSQINIDFVDQNEPGKSIINHNDTGYFFNKVKGIYWSITATHTVPAIAMSSTTNKISDNEFDILRPDFSGTVPFMVVDCTSASDFNFANNIKLSGPERCNGGVLRVSGAANTIIHPMTCFDNGTITNHIIEIGVATFDCRNTKILDYQRNGGTLDSNIKDIMLTDSNFTYLERPAGATSSTIIEIDIGNEPNTFLNGGQFFITENWPNKTNDITIASGAITVPESFKANIGRINYLRVDGEGAAADTLSTINGGTDGMIILMQSKSNARDITFDTAGNIEMAGSVAFINTRVSDTFIVIYNGEDAQFHEISRSDNQV